MNRKENKFICSHKTGDTCRRTLRACSDTCAVRKEGKECGECIFYHIPAHQEPCSGCAFCQVR